MLIVSPPTLQKPYQILLEVHDIPVTSSESEQHRAVRPSHSMNRLRTTRRTVFWIAREPTEVLDRLGADEGGHETVEAM